MRVARRVKRSTSTSQSASLAAGRREAPGDGAAVAGREAPAPARCVSRRVARDVRAAEQRGCPSGAERRVGEPRGEPPELRVQLDAQLRRLEQLGRLAHREHPGHELPRRVVGRRVEDVGRGGSDGVTRILSARGVWARSVRARGGAGPGAVAIVPQREKCASTHQAMSAATRTVALPTGSPSCQAGRSR